MSQLWIDPVNESSTSVTHTGTLTGTDIDRIVLRQATDYAGKQIIDNLVVATTFAEALDPDPGLDGDFNGDGVVDAADYVVWRKNGLTQAQFDLWRANFGENGGGGSVAGAAVPEPTTGLIFTVGIVLLSAMRRQLRR